MGFLFRAAHPSPPETDAPDTAPPDTLEDIDRTRSKHRFPTQSPSVITQVTTITARNQQENYPWDRWGFAMKIILAVDGSDCSKAAMKELLARPWPANTQVRIVSVAHPLPDIIDPLLVAQACHLDSMKWEMERARRVAEEAAAAINQCAPFLAVAVVVPEGSPKDEIIKQAEQWKADLIMLGSRGLGAIERFLLGSVASAVALHAPCSVEIVRMHHEKK